MNVLVASKTNDSEVAEEALQETAAVRGKSTYSTPLEQVKRGFYQIVLQGHATFRLAMVASLLNETALEALETSSVADALNFDLGSLAEAVPIAKLRDPRWMTFKPGNGTDKPFQLNFLEDMYNIPSETVQKVIEYMPENAEKGMPLLEFIQKIKAFNVNSGISSQLEASEEAFRDKYVDPLDDLVEWVIRLERKPFNEQTGTDSLVFHLSIRVDGSVYKEVVQSEKFEPYLMYLWVMNSLLVGNDRQGVQIVNPRIVADHSKRMSKFATVKPKVNSRGFAIHGSGAPMYIPPTVNLVDKFLDAANASINENGEFSIDILTEKGFKNVIIYVDWINDVMGYISNTGRFETVNLGQVHPLDEATEYMFLSTNVQNVALRHYMGTLAQSIGALDGPDAIKYTDNADAKDVLNNYSSNDIFTNVILRTTGENDQDVTLKHLVGHDIDKDYEDDPRRAANIRALKALFKLLREKSKSDSEAIKIADSYKSRGLLFRLIGIEYIIQTIADGNADLIEKLKVSYNAEKDKAKVDLSKHTFDIPNVVIGPSFRGLLPHQGRIISCTEKTPTTMMLPVQTGGGKTIISAVTAIKAIENIKAIPMITTKGNLVKGTITELNAISGGKLNAIPFRPGVIRTMKRTTQIKTFADFIKWYKSLPPNTILVNAYSDYASRRKLFEDLDTVSGFGDAPVYTTQYMLIIKLLGIRCFIGDESHQIKNPDSARSRNAYTAFSQGDVRALMSGTMVSNTIVDLVGQTRGASPYIFGDDAKRFADNYGLSTGLMTDEDATVIKDRLRSTTAYHEATREDWSYMLPTKDDIIDLLSELTPLQMEFYTLLMREAMLLLLEEEKRKGKKKKDADENGNGDDDEEDEDEEEDDEDEDEDEDAAFLAKAKVHLQKVEAFLVAPDENEQYVNFRGTPGETSYTKSPEGEDLVSPKVRRADFLIDQHLAKFKGNLPSNKIIVFGYNKVASQHFMRHSKHAATALHYTAGNEEVARRFETDPSATLMVADEASVREGFNWQMTSLILREQSVWAPGDHEQTLARMYRPDPRGKYNRDNVTHIWLMTKLPNNQPSLDAVKMARLVSKSISNARLTYEGRPEWRSVSNEFDDMELLKMNLELIFNAHKDDIEPYFDNWATFVRWENINNTQAKRRLAERLEAEHNLDLVDENGKIIDINKFIQLAMSEVVSTKDIPGSKRVWVPWSANAIPADPDGWGFRVMGQTSAPVGTAVWTQFGPAVIESILNRGVKVRLHDGRVIGMRKNVIMLVDAEKYPQLVKLVKDPNKWAAASLDPFGTFTNAKPVKTVEEKPSDDEEEVIEDLDDNQDDEEVDDFEVVPTIVNGWPALMILDDIPQLKGISDWKRVDPFLSISFRTWADVDKFLKLLDSKTSIPDAVYDALEDEMQEFKSGKALVLGKQINSASVRQFFQQQHKKLGTSKDGKIIANPYFIAVERDIKIAFDINSHEARLISWLMKIKEKITGVKAVKKNGAIWVNTFTTAKEAFQDLENLKQLTKIDEKQLRAELVEIKDEIMDLKKARSKPSI